MSSFNSEHNFIVTNIWEIPFGKGGRWLADSPSVINHIVRGWQVNSIITLRSGSPVRVTASGSGLNAPGNDQRPDQIVPMVKILGGVGRDRPYFDILVFAPVNEPRFGTAGWNFFTGPGIVQWDFGTFRNFSVREGMNLQFRFEAFNFTNTPQFGNPQGSQTSGDFGKITSTRENTERIIRFALRLVF